MKRVERSLQVGIVAGLLALAGWHVEAKRANAHAVRDARDLATGARVIIPLEKQSETKLTGGTQ